MLEEIMFVYDLINFARIVVNFIPSTNKLGFWSQINKGRQCEPLLLS